MLHAVNNVLVFVLAGALGDGVEQRVVLRAAASVLLLVTVLGRCLRGARGAVAGHVRPETRTAALDCGRRAARHRSPRVTRRPGVGARCPVEPSGIVFCGAARCHPWGMG